jgi:hypothetical protein
MLNGLEAKMTAVVADGMQSRAGFVVVEAPTVLTAAAGRGAVRVSVSQWAGFSGFQRDSIAFPTNTTSRRILGLDFQATLEFLRTPTAAGDAEAVTSRSLLLEDMSLVSHLLAGDDVRGGKAFIPAAPDPGFEVLSFDLVTGSLPVALASGSLSGLLQYQGRAHIWPPTVTGPEGLISAIDTALSAQPLAFSVDRPVTPAGGATKVRVRSLNPNRSIAVTVASDLAPGQRGAITSGSAGAEPGVRIVAVTQPETVIDYAAPAGNLGTTRVEFVSVYLATIEGLRGIFLGSATVHLQP